MAEWSFTVPGRPPSTNHMYSAGRTYGSRRKAPGVEAYQTGAALIVRAARPKGWVPTGQVRIVFDFWLFRDADCDNLFKSLIDAIAPALGINDKIVLPCARSKQACLRADERVEVTVSDVP